MSNDHIEAEVQRRLAREIGPYKEEINSLRQAVSTCREDLIRQNDIINIALRYPHVFGIFVKSKGSVESIRFQTNDEVIVIDRESPHYRSGGKIVSHNPVIDDDGCCIVKLLSETEVKFSVGLDGKSPAQIRLTQKSDGTVSVVYYENKFWEVANNSEIFLIPGDCVRLLPETKAIVGKADPSEYGDMVDEVEPSITSLFVKDKYKVSSFDSNLTWDDVGGLEEAKQKLKNIVELPFSHPELFTHYGVQPSRGVLFFGPPGCGKTLLARIAATQIAKVHGKQAIESGYIYVKAPEILDKYVGNSEKEIRILFERARKHYRDHGYKAVLAIDEADAIMPQRGTRVSSSISDTLVPMFLGEMDGIDSKETEENPIVFLLTNRADSLDPAVIRNGRISDHIKINRPDENSSLKIFDIHSKNIPFVGKKEESLVVTLTDLFSKTRTLYRINNEHDFTLGDCVNGAMIQRIVEDAKLLALQRDIIENTKTGVSISDLRNAVNGIYKSQRGLNHSYDLQDFADKLGIQFNSLQIERCFGSK